MAVDLLRKLLYFNNIPVKENQIKILSSLKPKFFESILVKFGDEIKKFCENYRLTQY